MTRQQQFDYEVKQATKKLLKLRSRDLKILDVELCTNLPDAWLATKWEKLTVASGLEKQLFAKRGLRICKKAEATAQALIGKKVTGCFVLKQYKMYWLKTI